MNLLNFFQSKIKAQNYLIAFSGGLDSTALLALFAKLREFQPHFAHLALRAIHIHHGLSPNADDWAKHCQQICDQLHIPLVIKKVQVDPKNGIEQGARLARYQAICEERNANEIVVTAHHLQDQTETFFLALKRGSGIKGLGAMQENSKLFNMPIFRPLLDISKTELEHFLKAENLPWIEDESNADNRYDRNFLRNQILPECRQRWEKFDEMVQLSARHCYNQQQLLNELLTEEFQKIYRKTDRTLAISNFTSYSKNKQNALLRMWLETLDLPMLGETALNEIIQKVIIAKADSNPQFLLQHQVIRRYQGRLYLTPKFADTRDFQAKLNIGNTHILPDNLGELELIPRENHILAIWRQGTETWKSRLPQTDQPIWLKFTYSGKVKQSEKDLNRDIKKIWQQHKIPVWQRTRIPLIFYGEDFKSAVGFFENF